jgi:hypothetical protein
MGRVLTAITVIGFLAISALAQEGEVPLLLPHRSGPVLTRTEYPVPPRESVTVPAETQVSIQVLSGIHTKVNHLNDLVTARLVQSVYVDGHVALPSGSILDGRITMIRKSGHAHRPAELRLRFDEIVLPDGQAEPMAGVLASLDKPSKLDLHLDAEGQLTGGRALSWKTLIGGAGLGSLGAIKAMATGAAAASMGLSLAGAAAVGYELLWPKGHEVNLPPETRCLVRLNYPLTVRVSW